MVAAQLTTAMKISPVIACLLLVSVVTIAKAQEPALIGGGSTRPQPVMDYVPPAPIVVNPPAQQHVRIRYEYEASSIPLGALPCEPRIPCAYSDGHPSAYTTHPAYPGYYQGCPSPTVIYFGRGEAARRGYNFRHTR